MGNSKPINSFSVDAQRRSREIDVASKNIDGISDLVVWAPIKEGFIDAFNNVTFESRLRLVAEALHSLRKSAREFEVLEPYADTAKRIVSLLDFRIGIVDRDIKGASGDPGNGSARDFRPRKYMYLVATFDGPWEPYMRLIYDPLGTFLDLVLCNCEGYTPALENDFETYAEWVRNNQLDSAIFYSTSGMTVGDKIYLEELERIQRTKAPSAAADEISRLTSKTPDEEAEAVRNTHSRPALKLGLEALNVLYKLTDLYPPNTGDGRFLRHATRDLLGGLRTLIESLPKDGDFENSPDLRQPLDWFLADLPSGQERTASPEILLQDIQKGLLSSYDAADFEVTHGALLLIQINDPNKVRDFLQRMEFSWEGQAAPIMAGPEEALKPFFLNIAFALSGLEKLGVPEAEIATFPKEFRQGMVKRAPSIGDQFQNHPRNWSLPERNWPPEQTSIPRAPIELSEIDFVLQVRSAVGEGEEENYIDFAIAQEKVRQFVEDFFDKNEGPSALFNQMSNFLEGDAQVPGQHVFDLLITFFDVAGQKFGFSILGVESMFRPNREERKATPIADLGAKRSNRDHFGFQDGISQPIMIPDHPTPGRPGKNPMEFLPGDLLYGHANTRGDQHRPDQESRLMFNGSFLVVRKISQDVKAFQDLEMQMQKQNKNLSSALLVGRTKGGAPLVAPGNTKNDFNYDGDKGGDACPLSAHIRLSNPRSEFHGRRDPKILRRGMSYGVPFKTQKNAKRGVMFMAFCASISEQYEVIQRWLNGGNSTGVYSGRNDPLTGALDRSEGGTHTFVCQADNQTHQIPLDQPLTKLEWGSYFFVPSRPALNRIASSPDDHIFKSQREAEEVARVGEGKRVIKEMEGLPIAVQQEEWKKVIEDFLVKEPTEHDITPRVWQAIDDMGGVYRVENGIASDRGKDHPTQSVILVTDEQLIFDVLGVGNKYPKNTFSSHEQFRRINQGFGTIYVCLDDNEEYYKEAATSNAILMSYDRTSAAQAGYKAGNAVLTQLKNSPIARSGSFKLELSRQFIQPAIAHLCEHWYGIPDGTHIKSGPWDWGRSRAPVCPGDFLSPSRHTFYPRPTSSIGEYGILHGQWIKQEGLKYIQSVWEKNAINGVIADKIYKAMKAQDQANPGNTEYYQDLTLRNMIGGMVGAIPPMDGCLRWALFDWLREETLWQYQAAYASGLKQLSMKSPTLEEKMKVAEDVVEPGLRTAMCIRPAPDLLYRTVTKGGEKIGRVEMAQNEMIILCLSAATQKKLAEGSNDVSIVFGGNRKCPNGNENPNRGLHSCPAKDLAMGAMTGMLASLLEVGKIQALPASLIVEITPH